MQQQTFFPQIESRYAEQQALLIGAVARLGQRKGISADLVEILRYLSNCDQQGTGARTYLATMVDRLGIARRTLQSRLAVLRQAGYLASWTTPNGRPVNRVQWEAIRQAAFASGDQAGSTCCQASEAGEDSTPRRIGATPRHSCATPRRNGATPRKTCASNKEVSVDTSYRTSIPPPAAGRDRSTWQAVEEQLFAAGVDAAGAAVQQARRHGVAAAEIEQLIEHYQQHREQFEGAGVLYCALVKARPGMPAADARLWPRSNRYQEIEF